MATQRQIESAHINGAKSRGPKTLEGKRRSSRNSRKHGLTSKTLTTDPESAADFHALVAEYAADLCPASPAELSFVQQMADAEIRRQRAWATETEAWNRALAAHNGCTATAFQSLAESNELARILRYETRFERQYHRALDQLLAAPTTRLQNEPEPPTPDPPSHDDLAKRTGPLPVRARPRCSHPSFPCKTNRNSPGPASGMPARALRLQNEPEPPTPNPPPHDDFAKRTEPFPVRPRPPLLASFIVLQNEPEPPTSIRHRNHREQPTTGPASASSST